MFVFSSFFCTGSAICFFSLQIVNTLIKISSCDDRRSISDIDSAHGQPAFCRARSTSTDDGLEGIRLIHGLRSKRLPAASYGILPNLKKKSIFGPSRRIEIVCLHSRFRAHPRPTVFSSYARPAPATRHRPSCEHGDPRVGWGALTSAHRPEFMTQSSVSSIDVCRGLAIPPLQTKTSA